MVYRGACNRMRKPVMLYTLPRTRATVLFYSCKRYILKDEIFADFNLDLNNEKELKKAFYKIDDPDTVLKIHGAHIARDQKIINWYNQTLKNNVYDIFVVERPDRVNTFLSLFLADKFGYNKRDEIEPFEFEVTESNIESMKQEIRYYLDYYPTYGKVISLENYPKDYFDEYLMNTDNQESYKKYHYIKNFDWTVEQISKVLDLFSYEWQKKINNLNEKNN